MPDPVSADTLASLNAELAEWNSLMEVADDDVNVIEMSDLNLDTFYWRVYDITDYGQVLLISEMSPDYDIYIDGLEGFNNGVYFLDRICKILYSKSSVGISRNMKVEDLNNYLLDFSEENMDVAEIDESYPAPAVLKNIKERLGSVGAID